MCDPAIRSNSIVYRPALDRHTSVCYNEGVAIVPQRSTLLGME